MPEITIDNFESVSLSNVQLDPGTPYMGQISEPPKIQQDDGKAWLEITTRVVEGPEQTEADPATGSKNPEGVEFTDRYYISQAAAWRIKKLLVATGLLAKDDTASPMAQGKFNSDILTGKRYPFSVELQINPKNGKTYRRFDPIVS